jgi:hypothetical protein
VNGIRNTAENSKLKWSLLSHRPRTSFAETLFCLEACLFHYSAPRHHRGHVKITFSIHRFRASRDCKTLPRQDFAQLCAQGYSKPRSRSRSTSGYHIHLTMPPRLPTPTDFPTHLILDIIPPSKGLPVNVLLLFHGLGDTKSSFSSLGTLSPSPLLPSINPPAIHALTVPPRKKSQPPLNNHHFPPRFQPHPPPFHRK